jgi:hypothetical protein
MEEPGESGSLLVPADHAEADGSKRCVFISYASHDAAVAQKVCSASEAAGFRCWIAPRNVVSGTLYAEGIVRALDESAMVVLGYRPIVDWRQGIDLMRAARPSRA